MPNSGLHSSSQAVISTVTTNGHKYLSDQPEAFFFHTLPTLPPPSSSISLSDSHSQHPAIQVSRPAAFCTMPLPFPFHTIDTNATSFGQYLRDQMSNPGYVEYSYTRTSPHSLPHYSRPSESRYPPPSSSRRYSPPPSSRRYASPPRSRRYSPPPTTRASRPYSPPPVSRSTRRHSPPRSTRGTQRYPSPPSSVSSRVWTLPSSSGSRRHSPPARSRRSSPPPSFRRGPSSRYRESSFDNRGGPYMSGGLGRSPPPPTRPSRRPSPPPSFTRGSSSRYRDSFDTHNTAYMSGGSGRPPSRDEYSCCADDYSCCADDYSSMSCQELDDRLEALRRRLGRL
ncbi:hypothetical protein EDD37DRAFT_137725 [Exophiala viscosa]|uniref:Uncharacterized protein n=1 Tax=Exophiala viscosa TaxID=2486360 RepID=A0AAN6I8Z5_9EURO|nr:hypothetical protein EDD36DRAFT_83095 [Exophiala viscosa]KAI1620909.1 hypothetical protein EDD37DRAFT_137725 [Exophiala viscosa]